MAMGGGSTMRAAAKVSSLFNSGFRGGVVPENPISAATRAVSGSIGSISVNSSSDGVNTTVAIDTQSPKGYGVGGFDDWDLIGSDEQARIFRAPPTIEEAKTATGELKDALEKIFVSSSRSNESLEDSIHSSQLSTKSNESLQDSSHCSQLSRIEGNEDKLFLMAGAPSAPKHAIQAFRFLDQSPEVQGVVASIASDPNVWEAVLQNPALQGYIRSQTTIFKNVHENAEKSSIQGDTYYQESSGLHVEVVKSDPTVNKDFKDELQNIWRNIKAGVIDMMTNLSDFFNSLFGVEGDKKNDGKRIPAVFEKTMGPYMMGVVVLVIMIVVLKRV